jgi:hypothetical protein
MARKPVFINANNNGYEPSQCGPTLTVGELIELLSDFDDDQPVYLKFDYGYSYGSIREHALELGEEELEEDEEDE